jgi:hypothetical protein
MHRQLLLSLPSPLEKKKMAGNRNGLLHHDANPSIHDCALNVKHMEDSST